MSQTAVKKAANEPLEALKDDNKALALFVRNLRKFDRQFCESMFTGIEFSLRLEVKGIGGELVHARVYIDEIDKLKDS